MHSVVVRAGQVSSGPGYTRLALLFTLIGQHGHLPCHPLLPSSARTFVGLFGLEGLTVGDCPLPLVPLFVRFSAAAPVARGAPSFR